ncbi:hypothetical protein VTN02DRAFT_890 [Thermoascus thermophilus]
MSISTWAETYFLRLTLLILAVLVGLAYSDAVTTSDVPSTEHGQQTGKENVLPLTCPSTNWRELIQAEYFPPAICLETRWGRGKTLPDGHAEQGGVRGTRTSEPTASPVSSAGPTSASSGTDQELDTDSPLDNANFLSFEDWKKQNLAKVGQSVENVGGHRQGTGTAREARRRPTGINNALDSLGEDAEIELEFGGFGAEAPEKTKPTSWGARISSDGEAVGSDRDGGAVEGGSFEDVSRRGLARRKDAGTTCKERFNYASFDCAATVLKTNPQCTGSSSVLIENKDSYMLNECRAKDKFLILELCDDILVDTIVLANYEFFSSIFRTFRVSVSDRYPAKPDKWKELGVFEARNTREVQAFAVENPLIWARYLKIEFLTHYGNEFYCPVSLVRVHGTTMLEEYKNDGEIGRAEDDVSEEVVEPADVAVDAYAEQTANATAVAEHPVVSYTNRTDDTPTQPSQAQDITPVNRTEAEEALLRGPTPPVDVCAIDEGPPLAPGTDGSVRPVQTRPAAPNTTDSTVHSASSPSTAEDPSAKADDPQRRVESAGIDVTATTTASAGGETGEQKTHPETEIRSTTTTPREEHTGSSEPVKATAAQPPSPNPTTQESFFKSVNKRLQMLESNSTLSLLYIEEQSRILRDAFNKVEKRQLAKTTTFLENLNTTVLNELREFREQYDRVWKSVAMEFEHQRIQYHQELYSMTAQLGILADELVFQKRVSVIQSVFVIVCFGLVLFTRGSVGTYIEFPRVQSMVSRSQSLRSSSPIFVSPSSSPNSTRPPLYRGQMGHRRNGSEDSQDGPTSPAIAYSPPTPSSDVASPSHSDEEKEDSSSPESTRLSTPEPPHFRPGSSPPTLSGHGDEVDPDEMVPSPRPLKPSDISRADAS